MRGLLLGIPIGLMLWLGIGRGVIAFAPAVTLPSMPWSARP